MHELPITQSILNIAVTEAEKHNAASVLEIRIAVGEMSGMVPECIQEYYNIVSDGTVASGAKLVFRKIPVSFECADCGCEFSPAGMCFRCEKCGSKNVKMRSGRELFVESIEIEEK